MQQCKVHTAADTITVQAYNTAVNWTVAAKDMTVKTHTKQLHKKLQMPRITLPGLLKQHTVLCRQEWSSIQHCYQNCLYWSWWSSCCKEWNSRICLSSKRCLCKKDKWTLPECTQEVGNVAADKTVAAKEATVNTAQTPKSKRKRSVTISGSGIVGCKGIADRKGQQCCCNCKWLI